MVDTVGGTICTLSINRVIFILVIGFGCYSVEGWHCSTAAALKKGPYPAFSFLSTGTDKGIRLCRPL
jgi:hypothetical protein